MPAPITTQTQESVRADGHYLFTLHQAAIASTAYYKLENFSIPSYGAMPTFEWACPSGETFIFQSGSGEISIDGTPFSSLGTAKRQVFFRWLNHFIQASMVRYNLEYGL